MASEDKKIFENHLRKIFQKLENFDHLNSSSNERLLFHVTVFNIEDQLTDFGLHTEHRWKWELYSSHLDGRLVNNFHRFTLYKIIFNVSEVELS